jgi:hypothetical protein
MQERTRTPPTPAVTRGADVSDDDRLVPLEDDAIEAPLDEPAPNPRPRPSLTTDVDRDWRDQGFDENAYEDFPPHWRD